MTTTYLQDSDLEGIIKIVRQMIDQNQTDEAVKLILGIELSQQFEVLEALYNLDRSIKELASLKMMVYEVIFHLENIIHYKNLYRNSPRSRDLFRYASFFRDLDLCLEKYSDYLGLEPDNNIDLSLFESLHKELLVDSSRDLALYFGISEQLDVNYYYNSSIESQNIINTNLLYRLHDEIRTLQSTKTENPLLITILKHHYNTIPLMITFEGVRSITADVLEYEFMPMFRALHNMQEILCEWKEINFEKPKIEHIKPGSIEIWVTKLMDAVIEFALGHKKRETEQTKLELETQKAQLDLEIRREEAKQIKKPDPDREKEIAEMQERMAQLIVRIQQLDDEANRWYLEKADEFVERNASHLSIEEKLDYIIRVADTFRKFDQSTLEITLAAKPPKPKNLPPSYDDNQPQA